LILRTSGEFPGNGNRPSIDLDHQIQNTTMKHVITIGLAIGLVLNACSKDKKSTSEDPDPDGGTVLDTIPYNALPQTQAAFNLTATDVYVNVMGSAKPNIPSFPNLAKKAGRLRGYVKNVWGRPLAGAYIGIRSSAIGGAYTMASGVTDSKGYYDIEPPFGSVHFFAAGHSFTYGDGMAAQGLYPADGQATSFASGEGAVENFVLLPYGQGDPAAISERPWYDRNYFGGAIFISYSIYEDMWSEKGSLPANSEIEVTLTPDGYLPDATERKTFVIRKKTGNLNFYINNIPVGRYKIKARLVNGAALKMKEAALGRHPLFGLNPDESVEPATLLFLPHSAQASFGAPNLGGWSAVNIKVELP
jgi:hypothetical protein